ncbi:hypothetical protein [Aurantiacibacter marinus]|uniref:hypothetical protein n=1 Tax=Aurantiacibacter marinus TaxID=874156 RepID=UPI00069A9EB0|nr:hypothetical protein [Aurantiacibacter marinus]
MRQAPANPAARRGGALVMLGAVLAVWLLMRVAIWQPPFMPASLAVLPISGSDAAETVRIEKIAPRQRGLAPVDTSQRYAPPYAPPPAPTWQLQPDPTPIEKPLPLAPVAYSGFGGGGSGLSRRGFAGAGSLVAHAYLLGAAYRSSAGATGLSAQNGNLAAQARPNGTPVPVYAPHAAEAMRRMAVSPRWSMDAWALWRQADDSPLLSGRPSYGRSQIGAVMRYNLAPSSGHAPQLHLRASAALEGRREREVALGVSARPIPAIPVRLAAEARVSETDRRTELRGAAYAVGEFPPLNLPGGLTGEAYVQGGYVTGDFATAFVDGQARITRELAGVDDFRLTAGAGAWGGAQEDAQRLDVGPTAGVSFRVGPARGRVSADYRFRVAGGAEPSSGPALTLSAGF